MTLADIQNSIYFRTQTSSTQFSNANMLLSLNNSYERVNAIIRTWLHNYYPTLWTSGDLSTGTATPKFDSLFHDLIPLWVSFEYAVAKGLPTVNQFVSQIQAKENELRDWYGNRNYQIFTVTIAAPGVVTKDNHGLQTNDRVIFETTGALPTGLSAATYYYVIRVDDHTFQLAATRNGSAITTSGSQSGTHYYSALMERGLRVSNNGQDSNK